MGKDTEAFLEEEGGLEGKGLLGGLGSLHLGRKKQRVQTWSSQVLFGEMAFPPMAIFFYY